MDGVLVNFNESYLKYMNIETPWQDIPGLVSDYMHSNDTETFWKNLRSFKEDFWVNMLPYSFTPELIKLGEAVGFRFLSSPGKGNPAAYSGKAKWIEKHYPQHLDKLILAQSSDKHLLVKSDKDILLDDTTHNITKWIDAGGSGVFFDAIKAHNYPYYRVSITENIMSISSR